MRKIDLIVIHCSATRAGRPYTPEQLERDHKARGFDSAGYNFYIRENGETVALRPLDRIPAHAKGHNWHSIGICYEGGLDASGRPSDTRTKQQKAALLKLVGTLAGRFPVERICGHRDLSPDVNNDGVVSPSEWIKQCPCFDAEREYGELTVKAGGRSSE